MILLSKKMLLIKLLVFPSRPKRTGKRKIEALPFAMSSNEYIDMVSAKNAADEDEKFKEERRKQRAELKKTRESIPKKPRGRPKKTI